MKFLMVVFLALFGSSYVEAKNDIKVIAFDAFPVFDPRPIFKTVQELFPEKADKLVEVWQAKQFSYTWLRTSGEQYKDFYQVTEDALVYAAKNVKVDLTEKQKQQIMGEYLKLKPWPDAMDALQKLKDKKYKITFLSNFTEEMLKSNLKSSKLEKLFSPLLLSTDLAKAFKPSPKAYNLAIEHFGVKKKEVLFVAFAPWDAAGAKWFGYPTFWVNRSSFPPEELGAEVDGMGKNLEDLVRYMETTSEK
ncbi:haloacid dehalogenase type II [Pseudobdellovibrio exovorus]|uniref:Haloacetate dehalogenase n=1 Tax=Pseudobdellovibrio exovorus JSS TaxID=1184267 RepID=M4VQC0_9BACT|nr:haloacid dehalogenase type II [Pseudobdellovibrio exovorus]AGH95354.1 hypothetical protein A11Q_1138 [Pseudobdellovibrio exovorus JSS]